MNKFFLFVIIILLLNSCREIYNPEIDNAQKTLVVTALITDEGGSFQISLKYARPFNQSNFEVESNAKVYVIDDLTHRFDFQQISYGVYSSNPWYFQPEYGRRYTLFIETQKGKIYKSSQQTLLPPGKMDSVYYSIKSQTYQKNIRNEIYYTSYQGLEFMSELNLENDKSPYYRFTNTLMVQYTSSEDNNPYSSCWIKYQVNDFFNLNNRQYNLSQKSQHTLGFCPIAPLYYGVGSYSYADSRNSSIIHYVTMNFHSYTISFKQYHLNSDVYKYYESINKQLEAKQRIFDPISNQVVGNITCLNDPDETVLGVFEVASVTQITYTFGTYISDAYSDFRKVETTEMDYFPITNCMRDTPYFWTYYK